MHVLCRRQKSNQLLTLEIKLGELIVFFWLVCWLLGFFVCVCVFFVVFFTCALLVHLISVSDKVMVSIFPSFNFIPLVMKTIKNRVDQVMLKTP